MDMQQWIASQRELVKQGVARFPTFDPHWAPKVCEAWARAYGTLWRLIEAQGELEVCYDALRVLLLVRNPWALAALRPVRPATYKTKLAHITVLLRDPTLSPTEIAALVGCNRGYVYQVRSGFR